MAASTGCTGLAAGGVIAVLRSSPTVGLFAAGTGLNCFALGSTYWGECPVPTCRLPRPHGLPNCRLRPLRRETVTLTAVQRLGPPCFAS